MINYPLEDINSIKKQRIDMLNEKFFGDIELTQDEEKILRWLCGWDDFSINNVISAFEKINK